MTSRVWPDVLLFAGMAFGVIGGLSIIFIKDIRLERRVYWGSWLLTSLFISVSLSERGWGATAIGACACAGTALLYAYLRTSYIKIGGRIHTYTLYRNRPDGAAVATPPPPDAYGNVLTAPKFWWTIALFALAAATVALAQGPTAATVGGGLFVAASIAVTGYIDGYEGFSVARRQYVQLAVITIASIPLLLLPMLAYVAAYLIGRRSTKS